MKNINNRLKLGFCAVLLMAASSCKKYVEITAPSNKVDVSAAFTSDAAATSSILGLYNNGTFNAYSGTIENTFVGGLTALAGASADDIYYSAGTYLDPFKTSSLVSSFGYVNNMWTFAYSEIYKTNAALEGLNASGGVSSAVKTQLLGETYFFRAFTYFYLTNLFGDVPLVTTTSITDNATLPRTSQATVYATIVSDLIQAQNLLSDTYQTTLRARVNKSTATALLARVYLYQKNYTAAITQSTAVISNSNYKMETLANTFVNTSNEVIWQLYTFLGYNQYGATFVTNSGVTPNYVLYPSLISSFETGDQRVTNWTKTAPIGTVTYSYPYKYKLKTATAGNEYNVMFRLAEQYLIRAEAEAQLNQTTAAAADINIIRTRAGLANTTASTQGPLLLAVENERAHELFSEMGHRWFDLKRTNRADAVLKPIKPAYVSTAVLWPVPSTQIQYNSNLTQNPGYN